MSLPRRVLHTLVVGSRDEGPALRALRAPQTADYGDGTPLP
jgi:hypothetical protein